MTKPLLTKKRAIALAFLFLRILTLPLATACPEDLVCGNFTNSDKIQDCEYVVSYDLPYSEEQETLCALWDQDYGFDAYQSPEYPPLNPDLSLDWNEISTSSFILAFKILLFLIFNYFLYSALTKPKWAKRWFSS